MKDTGRAFTQKHLELLSPAIAHAAPLAELLSDTEDIRMQTDAMIETYQHLDSAATCA